MKPASFFHFFKLLCNKRLYEYHARCSRNSHYVEVKIRGRVYLFRFSDHDATDSVPWEPDFDIRDKPTFNAAKKFIKSFDYNQGLRYATGSMPNN